MLSIIIPTINEEEYLPLLLNSIKKQNLGKDYEIIVADANSRDKTIETAKIFDCKVVKGGLPSRGRNKGAEAAKGDLLLFIDADVILPDDFLVDFLKWFRRKNLDIASCSICSIEGKLDKVICGLYNLWSKLTEKFLPHAANFIIVKREIHEKVGGFDETIKFAEDIDYARRAARVGKFTFFYKKSVLVSNRRFKVDGYISVFLKSFLAEIYMLFLGPIRTDIFNYKFDHYSPSPARARSRRDLSLRPPSPVSEVKKRFISSSAEPRKRGQEEIYLFVLEKNQKKKA